MKRRLRGEEYSATITDTEPADESRRTAAYQSADVVIICFSLVDKTSFNSVKTKWIKEVQQHCANTPVVLIGTKSDLLYDGTRKKNFVTARQVDKLLRQHPFIHEYCETSALTREGQDTAVFQIFDTAWVGPVRYILRMKTVKPSTRLRLIFLPCLFRRSKSVS